MVEFIHKRQHLIFQIRLKFGQQERQKVHNFVLKFVSNFHTSLRSSRLHWQLCNQIASFIANFGNSEQTSELVRQKLCETLCNVIWGKNCPEFHFFGTFAGAGAHHEGLRWLKPCQFQRTVYWHCECDKLRPDARLQLLAVCCSWTRGHKANEPCLTRLQLADMEVSINCGGDWKLLACNWSLVRDL